MLPKPGENKPRRTLHRFEIRTSPTNFSLFGALAMQDDCSSSRNR